MIVLVGGQGIGKSMLLQKLAIQQEFFNDSLTTFTGDESYMQIRNALIVEVSELSALRKSEDAEAKKFISSTHDTYRTKFEKHATPKPRRCIFAGTTNNSEFLRDQTGGRRFLPIVCYGSNPDKVANLSPEDVQQLWGEAYHLYKANPVLVLPKEAKAHAKFLQDAHTATPNGVDEFAQWLEVWNGNFISREIIRKEFLGIKNVGDISEGNKRFISDCIKYVEHTSKWERVRKMESGEYKRGFRRPNTN
jgi:predicted P-loop ATPase